MIPIKKEHTTHCLSAPKNWVEDKLGKCDILYITRTEDGIAYSYWQTSFIDRVKILFGRKIRLCVASGSHPPVFLDTVKD